GFDVRLTIDSALQQVAAEGLGDRRGAVVAIDPRTGEVLAMVSVPSFDPSSFSEDGDDIAADERFPLLNRAAQGLYPPGSTFKTVTAIAALEHRVIEPGTEVTCPGEIVVDGFPISCSNVSQGVGTYPFSDAFAFSVNAIFAQVGLEVGWGRLLETAGRLGFGTSVDFTLETAETQLLPLGTESTDVLLATTAFGQGQLLATPLQMALVAAAVGNDGVLMRPHLGLDAYDGERRVGPVEGESSGRVMPEGVARAVQSMMVEVIANGQANGVAISGVAVAGKTGTAETGSGTSHAWFIGFAPADDPVVAVAVVVENGGQGGVVASPIAGAVIRAALAD
ncbi:MAG TPA: penicillin-binding transpeptidase domain-containing protein, partial [Tepidiformaceae bacterium]|nr:penicillin-binding transpeptidase domain-containing protein [Tepidiformaceae bacterium]